MFLKAAKQPAQARILKEVLALAREEKGLTQEELAQVVCLKKWHIKEMEESDTYRTFYSMQIKVNAAKKIGGYLKLKENQFLEFSN
jgi:ribosome-binding protein aMBF1 (putative translation factor)